MKFVFKPSRVSFALFPLTLVLATACGGSGSPDAGSGVASIIESQVTIPGDSGSAAPYEIEMDVYPQVIKGWLPEYTAFVEAKIDARYLGLTQVKDSRITGLCPNWPKLSNSERLKFWSGLVHAVAVPESGLSRTAIYWETTLPIDSVTGQQIRSEGLLQLSYVDVVNYKYDGGDVSWAFDKTMALADYKSRAKSGNPKRTILNAYSNLNLGLFIMNRLVTKRTTETVQVALGRYWSTMRATSSANSKVKSGLKSYVPDCF